MSEIDGVPIEDIIDIKDGVYHRRERCSPSEQRDRYTVFVRYEVQKDKDTWHEFLEEIDVDAIDSTDARVIGDLALKKDYEKGGEICAVVLRPRGVMYF